LQLSSELAEVDNKLDSKKSAAQKAEEIKQTASSTAVETRQNISGIEAIVKQTAGRVKVIDELKNLEAELQVSRKKVKRIRGREVEDMRSGLSNLSKVDAVRANKVSAEVSDIAQKVERLDSDLSSQVSVFRYICSQVSV